MKVVRLSALGAGLLYPTGKIPGTYFCWSLNRPQGRSAAERIVSMEDSNATIGNRKHILCFTVKMLVMTIDVVLDELFTVFGIIL